jgi:hypothetical protein
VSFSKAQASKMLMDIAAKTAPAGPAEKPTEKMSPEEVVKKGNKKG